MSQSSFDTKAATWDDNPMRVAMAQNIAAAMLSVLPDTSEMTAIDFGCGTGLVSLALQSSFRHITSIDTSPGMLEVLNNKLKNAGIRNVDVHCINLAESIPNLKVDVIVSSMALHHVDNLHALLAVFVKLLKSGGYVALADLDTEDGTFHQDNTGIHHFGFDREWFAGQLKILGFKNIKSNTAVTIERPDANGSTKKYPVMLISGHL